MKKKILISIVFALITAIAAGSYFYLQWRQDKSEMGIPEKIKNYSVKEINNEQIIKNKNVGLSFPIPTGWSFEKVKDITGTRGGANEGIKLTSPDMVPNPNSQVVLIPKRGCLINIYVSHGKEKAEWLMDEIKMVEKTKMENTEIITIQDKTALKTTYGDRVAIADKPNAFFYITTEMPFENKIYTFETYIPTSDEAECTKAFNEFLKKIHIE